MPKVQAKKKSRVIGESTRHAPLGQVIMDDERRQKYASAMPSRRSQKAVEEEEEQLLDEKTSRRILALGQLQREEEEEEAELPAQPPQDEYESNDDEEEVMDDDDAHYVHQSDGYVTVVDNGLGYTPEEEIVAAALATTTTDQRRNLADIILAKIQQKEATDASSVPEDLQHSSLPPKVVEVYTDIGKILSRYTAGKLPKAFKVIPSLSNWEEILYLTRPDLWSPQAMYAATRIFASNLNPKMAQRFYHLVLLDAVRADIQANKKLNYHYYASLKKAVYKPAAFFKGILLPLCKEGDCTLREAAIVASVLQKVSIPVHHSAVAIHKLAQMEHYTGAASIFIRTLLNKKYSLPAPVIAVLVAHFASFTSYTKQLPVLWHQALLCFVQRYKNEVQEEQARESLKVLMKAQFHPSITPEIRRELFGVQAWKEEREGSNAFVKHNNQNAGISASES
eukprot:CAMPEP_0172432236 /NCGR_PEP_ID=MMETSP1064-20121228/62166_1 /TAXON_ID=202472 /ORGANISM="Aulacoseira subarctica , Strain CCAP 1002/5" /LENGTH=451 /DNA_ID=CAMNT_0013179383 /DNA_START=48 /DNA_END=1406 /DNA_ORIENTATION=+